MTKWLSSRALLQWPRIYWLGSWAWTYTPHINPCCGSIPHRRTRMTYKQDIQLCTGALRRKKKKWRKVGNRCQLRANLPHQKARKLQLCHCIFEYAIQQLLSRLPSSQLPSLFLDLLITRQDVSISFRNPFLTHLVWVNAPSNTASTALPHDAIFTYLSIWPPQ